MLVVLVEIVEAVRHDEPHPIRSDPQLARCLFCPAHSRRRHVDARHLPAAFGEPQGIGPLAAADVEGRARQKVAHCRGEGRVHSPRPHPFRRGVVLLPVRVPLIPPRRHRAGIIFGDERGIDGGTRHRPCAHRQWDVAERTRHIARRPDAWVTRGADRIDRQRGARLFGANQREALEEGKVDRRSRSHEQRVDRMLGAVGIARCDEPSGRAVAVGAVEHEGVDRRGDHADAAGDQACPHLARQGFGE